MVYGIYQSAAGLQVNQYRQAVLANNLANAETVGFKQDLSVVRERRVETQEDLVDPSRSDGMLDRMTGGTFVAPTYTSHEQGILKETGRKLDVALANDGFFMVQDGDTTRYTRDGRFTINREGLLVTVAGEHPVLSGEGSPIQVSPEAVGMARINADGQIQAGEDTFGRVGVVQFADRGDLCKVGSNLFDAGDAEPVVCDGDLAPGKVEMSTVDPTQSMVAMIEVSRAYELNATMIGLADSTLSRAVNDVGRIR